MLPEEQRAALLREAVEQLNRSLASAHTDNDVSTVLASFADPEQVVAASNSVVQADATAGVPSGALGLYLGVVGMVFLFLPWVGVAIGVLAVLVSGSAFRRRRQHGAGPGVALGGLAAGTVAIVLPLILMAVVSNIEDDGSNPTPHTVTVGGN